MRALTLRVVRAASIAAVVPGAAAAGGPPNLDVRLSCRAADRVSIAAPGTDKLHNDMNACLEDERTARERLVKTWSTFSAAARTLCIGMNHTGGPSSYVELLTCLEVMRDAGGP